jgi:hypothetical protein
MDPERQVAVAALARFLSGTDGAVDSAVVQCLRTKCQATTAKCLGRDGPCALRPQKMAARRTCRPLKQQLLAVAREDMCAPYVERMRPALMRQLYGDAAAVDARIEEMTRNCAATNVEKDKRYVRCIFGTLHESLAKCATLNCGTAAADCVSRQCGIRLPERPSP